MNVPWELIDGFLDHELTPGQETELRDWLLADRENVRVFVRATHLHRSLRTEMLAQKVLPGEGALSRTDDGEFEEAFGVVRNLSPSPAARLDVPTAPRDVVPFPQSQGGRFVHARGAIFALAASIALLIGLSVWLFPSTNNEPTLAVAPGTRVTLERNGQSFPAQDGLKLLPGDLFRISGSNGAAIIYGKEYTRVALKDDTELKTLAWRKGKRFELRQGKLEGVAARQRPFGPMVLLTMQAEARVLGTKFTLTTTTNATRLTAIRAADTDGNDATTPDVDWLPLRATPPHPEYPCAHCTVTGAMCGALAAIFGDDFTFTLETISLPGKPRTFQKFSEYAALTLEGRLYAGFHFRNSSVVGSDLGRRVGAYVFDNALTSGPTLSGQLQAGEFRITPRNRGSLQNRIEVSSDLLTWSNLTNYTSTDLTLQILDKNTTGANHKFYRAVAP